MMKEARSIRRGAVYIAIVFCLSLYTGQVHAWPFAKNFVGFLLNHYGSKLHIYQVTGDDTVGTEIKEINDVVYKSGRILISKSSGLSERITELKVGKFGILNSDDTVDAYKAINEALGIDPKIETSNELAKLVGGISKKKGEKVLNKAGIGIATIGREVIALDQADSTVLGQLFESTDQLGNNTLELAGVQDVLIDAASTEIADAIEDGGQENNNRDTKYYQAISESVTESNLPSIYDTHEFGSSELDFGKYLDQSIEDATSEKLDQIEEQKGQTVDWDTVKRELTSFSNENGNGHNIAIHTLRNQVRVLFSDKDGNNRESPKRSAALELNTTKTKPRVYFSDVNHLLETGEKAFGKDFDPKQISKKIFEDDPKKQQEFDTFSNEEDQSDEEEQKDNDNNDPGTNE